MVPEGLAPLLRSGQVVLIGEWHGTEEFPALVGDVVDVATDSNLAVTVGLEIACSEQPAIDDRLTGRRTGVDGPWWRRAPGLADGRSSAAMAALVDRLARRRAAGADVTVVAMDGPWVAPGSPVPLELLALVDLPRDEVMARRLLDVVDTRPDALTLVLAGSEHTRMTTAPGPAGMSRTMGQLVRAWHRDAVALLGRASGGTAWTITASGEPGRARPVPDDAELPIGALWTDRPGPDGHHGYVHVGRVTASPPAFAEVIGSEVDGDSR